MATPTATRRVNVNLSEEVVEALQETAKKYGVTLTEALRRAIVTQKFIEDSLDEDLRLLLYDPKRDETREVVFR